MADLGNGLNLDPGSTTPTTKSPVGPIIKESQESEEYQRALQTVVGTALGVILLVGILALIFLLYRLKRQRRRSHNGSQQHSPIIQRSVSVDVGSKPVPSVLVLYSYDCAMHEAVVVALSGLLMEVCGVTVSLDVFEENVIMERGLEEWLEDRLQEVDFILVVCSLGARLRCSKKRVRFREEVGRLMPDYFAVAVDYVAEKLRVERSKGLGVGKFVTVVLDYSRLSDIPPQLEAATSFVLMRDLSSLCQHLCRASPNKPLGGEEGEGEGEGEAWQGTEAGAEVWAALGQARDYFKTHPNWLEDRLEPVPPRSRVKPRRRRRHRRDDEAHDIPLLPVMPVMSGCGTVDVTGGGDSTVVDLQGVVGVVEPGGGTTQRGGSCFAHSRQNSLPSSLCSSHHPLAGPPAPSGVSRSVDSFPPRRTSAGSLGGGRGRRACCASSRGRGGGGQGGAARSLSRTILHAEVHKEWGAPREEEEGGGMDTGDTKHTSLPPRLSLRDKFQRTEPSHHAVPPAPRVWDLSKVSDAPKDWNSVVRPCGRVSPASVSSDSSSASSFSGGGHSGSDSLERDLRSITMPRIFGNTTPDDNALWNRLYGVSNPPRSLSSSALVTSSDGVPPVPFLTPLQPASHVEFTFDFSPIRWEGDQALEVCSVELDVEKDDVEKDDALGSLCGGPSGGIPQLGNSDS
ncbi:hypothetical protein ACOMHN_039926 [Nucella lapillus]